MTQNKTPLKVLHIITKLELGGAQINTIYTAEHLNPDRFITYLACGPGGILTQQVQLGDRLLIIPHLIRPIHPIKDLKAFFQLRKIIKDIKPDIVHTHSSKAGILGRLAAYSRKVPVIIHSVHGFSFSPFQSFFKRTFFSIAEKLISRITRHFIFVSRDDMQTAEQKGLLRPTLTYSLIRSGFPFEKFLQIQTHSEKLALRQQYQISPQDFVCGIIAPFKPQKGLLHLIEIASRVLADPPLQKKVIFFLAGDGAQRPLLESKLMEKGIETHFRLPGFIFAIEKMIDIFDLGISTALWEGLPQSLVQLRIKKKAVVASDIPGNREVIRQGENGFLVKLEDYDTFARQIRLLVEDDEARERLANFINEDFSPWNADNMVQEQERLYFDIGKQQM